MKREDIEKAVGDYSGSSLEFTDNNSVIASIRRLLLKSKYKDLRAPDSERNINWEQVRIKAAISTLQGFASNPNSTSATDEELALWSVRAADALIAKLKKGGEK